MCITSALEVVRTLHQLREHDLLGTYPRTVSERRYRMTGIRGMAVNYAADTFLPFDLEYASSAAFVLLMSTFLHDKPVPSTLWYESVTEILDTIAQVNKVGLTTKERVQKLHSSLLTRQSSKNMSRQYRTAPTASAWETAYSADRGTADPCEMLSSTTASVTEADETLPDLLGNPFFTHRSFHNGLPRDDMLFLADGLAQKDIENAESFSQTTFC